MMQGIADKAAPPRTFTVRGGAFSFVCRIFCINAIAFELTLLYLLLEIKGIDKKKHSV